MRARKAMKWLGTAASGAIIASLSSVAFAQTSADDSEDTADTKDVIVVRGFRKSLQDSLSAKRNAEGIVDVITAEDIGKFPDQNVAESLQRIPGVAIERERGEGKFVSIRGLGPKFSPVTVGGRTIASGRTQSPELGSLNRDTGREFSFQVLPSELVGALEVYKSPSADLVEGGIGGLVNIKMRRPTDDPGLNFGVSARGIYDTQAEDAGYKFSSIVSNTFMDDTLGILLSGSYSERTVRQDSLFSWGWIQGGVDDLGTVPIDTDGNDLGRATTAAEADNPNAWSPFTDVPKVAVSDETVFGFAGTIDYKPNDQFTLLIDGLYTSRETVSNVDMLEIRWANLNENSSNPRNNNVGPFGLFNTVIDPNSGRLISGDTLGPGGYIETTEVTPRDTQDWFDVDTLAVGANATWDGDGWSLSGDVGYSEATSLWYSETARGFGNFAVQYDFSDQSSVLPSYVFSQCSEPGCVSGDITDPNAFELRRLERRQSPTKDDEFSAKLDLDVDLELGIFDQIEFGVRYADRTKKEQLFVSSSGTMTTSNGGPIPDQPRLTFADLPNTQVHGGGMRLGEAGAFPTNWALLDGQAVFDQFGRDLFPMIERTPNGFEVTEESLAGYVKANFSSDGGIPFSGNFGIRVVDTDTTATGASPTNLLIENNQVLILEGEFATTETGYTKVLPSFNIKFEPTDKVVIRGAVGRSLTRPQMSKITPKFSFSQSNPPTGTGGNPDLDPFTAWNYDLSLEYYFAPTSLLQIGAFYKNVQGFVFNRASFDVVVANQLFASVVRPENAATGDIYGLEFIHQQTYDFLPQPFDGLGTIVNYTLVESSKSFVEGFDPGGSVNTNDFEGLSKHSINATIFYEKGPLQARLTYNWRSKFLETTAFFFSSRSIDDYGQLDATIQYDIGDKYQLTFEAVNLNNGVQSKFDGGIPELISSVNQSGRRFFLGARYTY